MTQGGSNPACAVCKFQRRKCKPDCLLAHYFPGDQPRLFHNVHRLFGVSNMLKILEGLHPSQHAIAMQTMIDEANMRIWYPIHGCLGVIHNLKSQIQILEDEIRVVYSQLVIYRQKMATLGVTGDVAPPKTDPDNKYVNGGTCHGAAIQVASTVLQKIRQEAPVNQNGELRVPRRERAIIEEVRRRERAKICRSLKECAGEKRSAASVS